MSAARWWRIKPARAREWHAADHWSLGGRDLVTLCNKPIGSDLDQVLQANAITLVECLACRTVLLNRDARGEL